MNSFFPIFPSFYFLVFFLWIFLFAFLFFKITSNKLSFNDKLLKIEKKSVFSSVTYQKTLYLLLLMFLLTQLLPWSSIINNKSYDIKNYVNFLYYFISIFTLLTYYFFIFSFFLIINSNKTKKKCTLQCISFSLLFLNSFFNLIIIPNQALILWQNVNFLSIFALIFLYILVLRLFLNLFKYFFNYSIKQVIKFTIFIFNYQGIKAVFINSENKVNILTFFQQLWSMLLLISENQEEYILLINTVAEIANSALLTINIPIKDNEDVRINTKFIEKNKKVFLKDKTLKDYIFINGWKMSLIQ